MDPKHFERQVQALSALDDPARRRLYLLVAARGELSRDQAARGAGISRTLAAFHLDKLVDAGLLDGDFLRRSGRPPPGAARPSNLERRWGLHLDLALPERRSAWAAQVLAGALGEASSPAATQAL